MNGLILDFCETKQNSFMGGNYISNKELSDLDFLLQIDLKEVNLPYLPKKGILYFFYDLKNNINYDNKNKERCKVIYENKLFKSKHGNNKINKKYLKINDKGIIYLLTNPITNNYHNYNLELISRNYNLEKGDRPLPYLIDDIKKHEKDWILLLQIKSNENLKIADNGSLYFYIKEKDLKQLNFNEVYCIKESC